MDNFWPIVTAVILASIPGIIVAVVSSSLAARQARKQHVSQRWWEKKAEVYSELLRSLHGLKYACDVMATQVHTPIDEYRINVQETYERCLDKLGETINVGTFIISKECHDMVCAMADRMAINRGTHFQNVNIWSLELGEHIKAIIAAAKKDLGV